MHRAPNLLRSQQLHSQRTAWGGQRPTWDSPAASRALEFVETANKLMVDVNFDYIELIVLIVLAKKLLAGSFDDI